MSKRVEKAREMQSSAGNGANCLNRDGFEINGPQLKEAKMASHIHTASPDTHTVVAEKTAIKFQCHLAFAS